MRILWGLLFLLFSGAAGAAPKPAPPAEYSGDQYIDGQGCVFTQKNGRWEVRRDRDGNAVCGFPPTLSARRIDPDSDILPSMQEPSDPPGPEQLLREQLAIGLRQGEFLADPREVEERREPEVSESDDDLIEGVRKMLLLKAEVDAKLAGNSGDPGLCARLGYVPDLDPRPTPGADVTLGLCPGQRPSDPVERRLLAAGTGGEGRKPIQAATALGQAPVGQEAGQPLRRVAKASAVEKVISRKEKSGAKTQSLNEPEAIRPKMIPASARYVQVGVFPDDISAEPAIQRLKDLGYPVAWGHRHDPDRKARVILAGPFDDRRSLVAALIVLRGKGYSAVAH